MTRWAVIAAAFLMVAPSAVFGQTEDVLRFADRDGDGINDMFRDADGDGVNDVDGRKYSHRFDFKDNDGDGINDLFRDADGDGVNDVGDETLRGIPSRRYVSVLDFDNDGVNDVTGEKYVRKLSVRSFVDENGDGIDDRETWLPVKKIMGKLSGDDDNSRKIMLDTLEGPTMDRFIDENRDGINDGRVLNNELTTDSLKNKP